MPQHLLDLPWLQRVHEGQGPARRPLHHQPHLRHLRRQPRHLLRSTPRTWPIGIRATDLAEWIINLGEAAEYMFDHCIFQDNLVFVDFCEQMVKETNPSVLSAPRRPRHRTPTSTATAPSPTSCGRFNPFTGESYREALQMSRLTREMFCLMEGPPRPPLDALPRRRRAPMPTRAGLHRLSRPADARTWTSSRRSCR